MKQQYTPLTKLLILVGVAAASWMIVGLAVYGAVRLAVLVFGQTI